MEEALNQLSLNSTEIHASLCDYDIDGGSDSISPTDQDVPSGIHFELHSQIS